MKPVDSYGKMGWAKRTPLGLKRSKYTSGPIGLNTSYTLHFFHINLYEFITKLVKLELRADSSVWNKVNYDWIWTRELGPFPGIICCDSMASSDPWQTFQLQIPIIEIIKTIEMTKPQKVRKMAIFVKVITSNSNKMENVNIFQNFWITNLIPKLQKIESSLWFHYDSK